MRYSPPSCECICGASRGLMPRLLSAVVVLATSDRLLVERRSPVPGWPTMLKLQSASVPAPPVLSMMMASDVPLYDVTTPSIQFVTGLAADEARTREPAT